MLCFTNLNAVAQLCPNCGLCCDSTLFADVELRSPDDPKRLRKLGLIIKRKDEQNDRRAGENAGKAGAKLAFAQPCSCFDGSFCKIYDGRPTRCRLFECGLLKKVMGGHMSAASALKKISEAKALVARVRDLLESSGHRDQNLPLIKFYSRAMEKAIDLTDVKEAKRRGKLMLAMRDLMRVLQAYFLQ